jgi:hypothetical protein
MSDSGQISDVTRSAYPAKVNKQAKKQTNEETTTQQAPRAEDVVEVSGPQSKTLSPPTEDEMARYIQGVHDSSGSLTEKELEEIELDLKSGAYGKEALDATVEGLLADITWRAE